MRVERRNVIDADRDAVWKIVSDPDSYPSFMTTWSAGRAPTTSRLVSAPAISCTGRSARCRSAG